MSKHNLDEKLRNAPMDDEDAVIRIGRSGGHLLAWGDTVPTDADTGYATGCLFFHLDGSADDALYINEGDADSCDFNEVNTA